MALPVFVSRREQYRHHHSSWAVAEGTSTTSNLEWLCGEFSPFSEFSNSHVFSVQAIAGAFADGSEPVKLPGWIAVTGAVVCVFALLVPTLHALRFFSSVSLALSSIYTYIAIAIAINDGTHSTLTST